MSPEWSRLPANATKPNNVSYAVDSPPPENYTRALWRRGLSSVYRSFREWPWRIIEAIVGGGVLVAVAIWSGNASGAIDASLALLIGAPATLVAMAGVRFLWGMATLPRLIYYEQQQEIAGLRALCTGDRGRLEEVRKILLAHAQTAPDSRTRNTDTVSNWRRRAKELLEHHTTDEMRSRFVDCPDHCIQEQIDASRASFEKIAINLKATDLLP